MWWLTAPGALALGDGPADEPLQGVSETPNLGLLELEKELPAASTEPCPKLALVTPNQRHFGGITFIPTENAGEDSVCTFCERGRAARLARVRDSPKRWRGHGRPHQRPLEPRGAFRALDVRITEHTISMNALACVVKQNAPVPKQLLVPSVRRSPRSWIAGHLSPPLLRVLAIRITYMLDVLQCGLQGLIATGGTSRPAFREILMGMFDTIFVLDERTLVCPEGHALRSFQTKDLEKPSMRTYLLQGDNLYLASPEPRADEDDVALWHIEGTRAWQVREHQLREVLPPRSVLIYTTCGWCEPVLVRSDIPDVWGDIVREHGVFVDFRLTFRVSEPISIERESGSREQLQNELRARGVFVLLDDDPLAVAHKTLKLARRHLSSPEVRGG